MKTLQLTIIIITVIVVIPATLFGVFIEKVGENQQQPYTGIAINGVKDNYTVTEPVVFSIAIEGYGTGCGDTKVIITKENDSQFKSPQWSSTVQCVAFAKSNYFKFNRLSENTTITQPGNYTFIASFDDAFTYRHTEVKKKFSVMPYILTGVTVFHNDAISENDCGKYYQVLLHTGDTPNLPQVSANFAIEPVSTDDLSVGKSVNYTITVQTLATFGAPVSVKLYPVINAQDSGITAKIIPDTLSIPERSTANATLVITAGPGAQNGTYDIGFNGQLKDGTFSGGMRQTSCPCIRIGDSDWTIRTYYGDSGSWGGKSPPSWLQVETTTEKNMYHTGEPIEIKNFIINNSTNTITLESNKRLFVTVYNQVNGTGAHRYFYGIDAFYEGKPITLGPHSKTMIARPFYWDQSTLGSDSVLHNVISGTYHIDANFGSYKGGVWDNDFPITVR